MTGRARERARPKRPPEPAVALYATNRWRVRAFPKVGLWLARQPMLERGDRRKDDRSRIAQDQGSAWRGDANRACRFGEAAAAALKSVAAVMRMRTVSGWVSRARARNSAPLMPGIM